MKQVGNTILAKGGNHILAKRDNSAWPKGSKLSGFSTQAITRYEKRLTNVNVRVIIDDTTRQDNVFEASTIKKRVQVYVYGNLVHTGEKRCFYYVIYLGPISTR